MITYTEERLGTIIISQQGKEYEIQIRRGNCLAVFIHVSKREDGKYNHMLYMFFADKKHIKNKFWSKLLFSLPSPDFDNILSFIRHINHVLT